MMKFTISGTLAALTLAGATGLAFPAAATPILGVSYASAQSTLCNHACIDGYQFAVPVAGITVVALGAFDGAQGNPSNGGAIANLPTGIVDLFDSAGTVLASVSVGVGTSGTQLGLWEFVNLTTPVGLTQGNYIVANAPNSGASYDFSASPESVTVGSGITFKMEESCTNIAGQFNGAGCNLSPTNLKAGDTHPELSNLGGNIEFNIGLPDPPRSAPEPVTLAIFGAGLAGAAALRRRRAKA